MSAGAPTAFLISVGDAEIKLGQYPDLLQLKEGSTSGVRSCFSSRRDRPLGSDLASARGGIDPWGPILLEPKELPHRDSPNFLRTNSSGDG